MNFNIKIIIYSFIVLTACSSDEIVQYFEYPDHNVLNIGSQLTDLYVTNDSNTLIVADKGNNRVLIIDVSTDEMYIKNTVWVGSEPTSLEMTADGRYLFVGLLGGSSVSVINMATMKLEGSLNLEEDSVFDIEYLSVTCQLIVSFLSTNPTYNKTYVHAWWADQDGVWYGNNTSCSYSEDPDFIYPEITVLESNMFAVKPTEIDNVQHAGLLSMSQDEFYVYILDKTLAPNRLHRYDIDDVGLSNRINNAQTAKTIDLFHDLEYISNFGVVVALSGTDPVDGLEIDHAPVYDFDNLDHISNLDVGSAPLAVAYDAVGEHIYISPTDVDDNGMFIVEFSITTQLQTNYYQVAGLLGSHGLVVDPKGEYIYAAVDDLSDQDNHEPYNGSSFNIQKIKIIPEGTYPVNDF
ncbi:MAG: hypothetical protein H8E85_08125 [Candidatus Marinimicrobia bacterium]|nr:hypothetical protein [Candidatus Neomarinimicrobiota bacterium]